MWVADLERAAPSWGWLVRRLGYEPYRNWPAGRSRLMSETYLVIEQSAGLRPGTGHDRMRPGLNHLAFHVGGGRAEPDALVEAAPDHGWTLMLPEVVDGI
jgi:hypothetical protein